MYRGQNELPSSGGFIFAFLFLASISLAHSTRGTSEQLEKLFAQMSGIENPLVQVGKLPLLRMDGTAKNLYHPQGVIKLGSEIFISTVHTTNNVGSQGHGYLYKFGADGVLKAQKDLGRDSIIHPGGLDFDGDNLIVPVAEYKAHSQSNIFAVDPETLKTKVLFKVKDHIGSVIFDSQICGFNWDGLRMQCWNSQGKKVSDRSAERSNIFQPVDAWQDCKNGPDHLMVCSGVWKYFWFKHGIISLLDKRNYRAISTVIITETVERDTLLTQEGMDYEVSDDGSKILFYFAPEDGKKGFFSHLYTYSFSLK